MRLVTAISTILLSGLLAAGCAPKAPEAPAAPDPMAPGSHLVELNGRELHYEIHGDGPVLMVMPNSWGLDVAGLRAIYGGLEERLSMVYFDPRGMGGSGDVVEEADMGLAAVRADFDALRAHLGFENVDAIGWSNGATNLVLHAAEYPETLDRAIFLHGVAHFDEKQAQEMMEKYPDVFAAYEELEKELSSDEVPLEEKTARMKRFWVEEWFTRALADPETMSPKLIAAFEPAEFSWKHGQHANVEGMTVDGRPGLASIAARCLVIAGAHDMAPPEASEVIADGVADSEFMVFESSGHFAPLEEPERFESAVYAFLGLP